MNMYDIIEKKKHGEALTKEEIAYFVQGFTNGEIPDYQASALLMAIYFQGMNSEETVELTVQMEHSGDVVDLGEIKGIKVDKHSTGGVGDKTSLVLGPMLAACGLKVAKMSGRALGHTGGTIDKLEAIEGFRTELSKEEFVKTVNDVGMAVIGQTGNITPADKKLYALRDVTATVDNISLIASSIMSKKLAGGAEIICLDVKTGSGAFMETLEDSEKLAKEMVAVGNGAGRKVSAIISDMNQPLGYAVGNSLELHEAINSLKGNGPEDLMEVCYALGTCLLVDSGVAEDEEDARDMLEFSISTGSALVKFYNFIAAQGGNAEICKNLDLLPLGEIHVPLVAESDGYIYSIDCKEIGLASLASGAGRRVKEDVIDFSAGILFEKKVGAYVNKGDVIATVYSSYEDKAAAALERAKDAIIISDEKPEERPVVYKIIK
ncbi:MAG: pyrimidine-nucleoside phosphorylase [Anaerofustis stercorihominis]|nr:pyrimidine-nucleoside phosphorylase [Anaerofustis stercorihominis]